MTETGRFYWKFPEKGVRVQWRPRSSEFSVLYDGVKQPDGINRVQIVKVEDEELAGTLIRSLCDGICPVGNRDVGWPVEVTPSYGIPADDRWHRCGCVVMVTDTKDPDSEADIRYVVDPMEAQVVARTIWNDMPEVVRGRNMVMACRIDDDFPITGQVGECIWVSDPDTSEEGTVWEGVLPVAMSGGSLILRITPACKRLRCQAGDVVQVTIKRI